MYCKFCCDLVFYYPFNIIPNLPPLYFSLAKQTTLHLQSPSRVSCFCAFIAAVLCKGNSCFLLSSSCFLFGFQNSDYGFFFSFRQPSLTASLTKWPFSGFYNGLYVFPPLSLLHLILTLIYKNIS